MDIRQALLIRKLRTSVIGVEWADIIAEYTFVVALLQFCGHYQGHEKSKKDTGVPDGAVVFGGST